MPKTKPHKSEFNLASFLDSSQARFLILDAWGRMYGASPQLASVLHFQQEELCGFKFQDMITKDFDDDMSKMIEKVQTSGGWMSMPIPMYTKDAIKPNTVLHVITSTGSNALAHSVYVVIEPEPTSAGEDAENRLWTQLGTPAAEVNANSEIAAWNEQMIALSGFSREEMVGRSFLDLFTVDALQKVRRLLCCSHKGEGASTCKTTLYTITGIPKLIRLHAMACRDGAGKLIRIAVAAQQTNEDIHCIPS